MYRALSLTHESCEGFSILGMYLMIIMITIIVTNRKRERWVNDAAIVLCLHRETP